MCSNPLPTAVQSTLTEAEALLNTNPDSALLKLKSISQQQIDALPKSEHALYCLLFTSATDKSYGTHISDSLISIAANFYEKEADLARKAQAWYTMGRVNQDLGDAVRAQKYYLKALEDQEVITDYELLGTIQNNLGMLFIYQDVCEKGIPYLKDAVKYFEITSDSVAKPFALRNIGRAFDKLHQQDSVIFYYQEALRYSTKKNKRAIYAELGSIYRGVGDYTKAYKFLLASLNIKTKECFRGPVYLTLGELFCETEQQDSAYFYLLKSMKSPNVNIQKGATYRLSQLAKQNGQWSEYISRQEEYEVLRDSVFQKKQTESIRRIQYQYDYQQAELKLYKSKLEHKKTRLVYSLILLALSIFTSLLIVMYFVEQRRRRQLQVQQNKVARLRKKQQAVSQWQEEKDEKQIEALELENGLTQLKQFKYKKENTTLANQEQLIELFVKSDIYRKFQHAETEKINSLDWEVLIEGLNITYDFTNRIIDLLPKISDKKIKTCYLTKIELPVVKIAVLLNTSPSNVSNIRSRLYKEITGEKESADKFVKLLQSIH